MKGKLMRRVIILSILLFITILSLYLLWKGGERGELTVAFLNIGQGDAIFIESPSGNQMLIDGGPGKAVLRELSAMMPFYDRSLDVVLLTHADQDHAGGLPDVLERYKVNLFIETGNPGESSSYEELESQVASRETQGKTEKILARKGMVVELGGGVNLEILFPDRDPSGMETNLSSIVARLVYGESEFMLTGDSPSSIEEYLISVEDALLPRIEGHLLRSDVLKAGHHGSKTSTSELFVKAVMPQYAVISSGKENRYGHPTPEVLETLESNNVKILRTDEQGRIIFQTDGINLRLKK